MRPAYIGAAIIALTGIVVFKLNAAPVEGAADYYQRYLETVRIGRSFEQDAAFFAADRRAEVDRVLEARGDDAADLRAQYLAMTEEAARCMRHSLIDEQELASGVRLVFGVEDTCGLFPAGATIRDVIELVREDGWKIRLNETEIATTG